MSLLLEALKKAEMAKEEAQKRAREGESDAAGELRLADEQAAPADEKHVVTRDELPPITAPLEIQSEDIGAVRAAAPAGAQELSLQGAPRPAASQARPRPEPQAAQRAAARKPFEAKVREPNPRLPFYLTVGALGVLCVATAIYFWIQLRPPASLYVSNPKPPANEQPVAVPPPPARPEAAASSAIPGLPNAPLAAPETKPAPPPPPRAQAAPSPAPRAEPRPRVRPPAAENAPESRPVRAALSHSRPPARIHPLVSSGYAAYQAGDLERARQDYQSVLRDEPGNRDALLGLAAVETRAGRRANAETLYRRLLQADPRDPHAQAGLLGLRSAEVDPVSAESRLKGLIANDSTEGVLYFSLGNQYAQQGRWPEALQAYAKATAMEAENPDFAYNYAVSLEHAKQPLAAVQQYRRALALALRHNASFDPAAAQVRVETLSR